MGSTIQTETGDEIVIVAGASLNPGLESLDRLELIIHGDIVATADNVASDNSLKISHSLVVDKGLWIAIRAYGSDQAAAHSSPVYVVTDNGGFANTTAVADIVQHMMLRLDQFDPMTADARNELEVWSVGEPLQEMLKKQRRQVHQRVDKARRTYAALTDR